RKWFHDDANEPKRHKLENSMTRTLFVLALLGLTTPAVASTTPAAKGNSALETKGAQKRSKTRQLKLAGFQGKQAVGLTRADRASSLFNRTLMLPLDGKHSVDSK
ncbi:MAG: hypothetical protein AAF658_22605, partial [Myxococcota bacterium]